MTAKQIYDTIEKAINEKRELLLTVKHGLGSILPGTEFQAYVLGDDAYQYSFAWGYLPENLIYYRFSLDSILEAKITDKKYDVREDACYQHSIDEDHFARLEGFTNVYANAARHSNHKLV